MKLSRVLLLSALALPILALSQSVRPPTSGTWDLGQPTFPWENTYSLNLHGQQAAIGGLIIVGPEALAGGGGPLDVALDSTTWSGTQGGPTVHTGHVTVLSGTFTAPSIVGDNSIARATGDTYTGTHAFGGATVTGISRLDASDGSPTSVLTVDASGKVLITRASTYTSEGSGAISILDSGLHTGMVLGADTNAAIAYIQSLDPGTSYFTRSLVLNPNGGNVGIRTTSPSAPLHVVYPYAKTDTTERKVQTWSSTDSPFSTTANKLELTAIGDASTQAGRSWLFQTGISATDAGNIVFQPGGGNVGIGTTTPLRKLQISSTGGTAFDSTWNPGAVYGLAVLSSDSEVRLVSDAGGSIGSQLSLVEMDGNTLADAWSLLRQTSNGSGDGSLRIAYGTNANVGVNPTMLTVSSSGNVGIGTTAPAGALDVVGAWALIGGTGRADASDKFFRIGMAHYLASEEPAMLLYGFADDNENRILYGGGTSAGNAATEHRWYTATDSTTTTGTERMRLNSTGLGIGTTNPSAKLDVVGDAEVSGTVTAGAIVAPNNINVTSSGQTAAGKGEHWHLTQDAQVITCPAPFTGAIFHVTTRNGDHAFEIEPHSGGQLWQIGASAPVAADGTIEIQFGKCRVFWDGAYWMVDGN